jgi:hypothetical protein
MKALILICLTAFSATAQNIDVEFDQAANFEKYHTFAIREGQLNNRNPALNNEVVKKRIEANIERGLTKVTSAADLNVRFHFGATRKAELDAYPAGWRGWGTRVVRVPYTEGTLVIDLRDPATRSLVWIGIAREDKSDAAKNRR